MLDAGTIVPQVHDQVAWVEFKKLTEYSLLPADVLIAEKLSRLGQDAIPAYAKLEPGDTLENEGLMRASSAASPGV